MSLRSKLETALGLTRGDVTIALFVALTALTGFLYLTFFDDRLPDRDRLELLRLQRRYDSIVAERASAPLAALHRDVTADTLPALATVLEENAAIPEPKPARRAGAGAPAPASVDLNKATKEVLESLPGVGEKTAEAIIERRGHVPFRRPEDLMEVKGIGEKKLAKIRPYLRFR
jgi:competence ComEA-like helix-hairpin-helix protein